LGPVETLIRNEIMKFGTICAALIDSEELGPEKATDTALKSQECGASLILVGGSTAADQMELDAIVKAIKSSVKLPVILFPGNVTGLSPNADAILFSSLLNSDNPYFITEAQALSTPVIRKYGLEVLPMGYIVIGDGGTIGFVGRARGIPPSKPKIAAMYALAAQYMGMRYVYLEAGSGVTSHTSSDIISSVRKVFDGVLISGGGIKTPEDARSVSSAGADIIVVGTLLESEGFESSLRQMILKMRRISL
jgi:phosphoglycerol geranylgeranyltransferase